jgi:hypothetical protein
MLTYLVITNLRERLLELGMLVLPVQDECIGRPGDFGISASLGGHVDVDMGRVPNKNTAHRDQVALHRLLGTEEIDIAIGTVLSPDVRFILREAGFMSESSLRRV